ncbi:MAG: dihydroorotase [Firmicutes bacterium]|nr:dihydroorotase [Bacillota bacterium]MBR6585642.1 dihydroorotase [Bacillota bacterium]
MKNLFLHTDSLNETTKGKIDSLISQLDKDAIIVPSFVDVHVHLREPGFFYKETIKTGTQAAARGGYSWVCSMPNLNPVPDCMESLQQQLDIIKKDAVINVVPYGAITVGEKGREMADLEAMAPHVIGFSDDGVGLNDKKLMKEAMVRAKAMGKMIVAHCEDMEERAGGYIHDGKYAKKHGHKGINSASEWKPVERDLKLAEETGCSYHVCHISTKETVEVIRKAKARGVDVTCETAPHYLVFCDEDLQEDARFKMNPPIRSAEDRQALIEGLLDGTIDMIATDHAPHSEEEKSRGLKDSAMGIVGLETAFPVMYTHFVKTGIMTMEQLVKLMSENPRKRFGLPSAEENGDFAVWELGEEYEVNPEEFATKGRATPFAGHKVYGKCLLNVCGGKEVYKAE